jgi:hypothetical protein
MVHAAIAHRRLAQGLLNTRRFGRQLASLPASPRSAVALAAFEFAEPPLTRLGGERAFPDGVELWLGAETGRIASQFHAFASRTCVAEPVICLRLEPGLQRAIVCAPLTPPERSDGPWTSQAGRDLCDAMVRTLTTEAPEIALLLQSAEILSPRVPAQLGGTGALFGGGSQMAAMETIFGFHSEPSSPLKGLLLSPTSVFGTRLENGLAVAEAALTSAKLRA